MQALTLKNFILVEACTIQFEKGFTVLSGETGAGKTAIVEAIHLILGGRADSALIRSGEGQASVEAAFDIEKLPALLPILQEAGIDFDPSELLFIRRELVRDGKNRSFINSQMVPLPLLQKLGRHLIDLVDQHSHQSLQASDYHRDCVDLFAGLEKDVLVFCTAWEKEKTLQQTLEELQSKEASREKELDAARFELKELDEAAIEEGEEERLFEEYRRLASFQELSQKLEAMASHLGQTLLPALSRHKSNCQSLISIDPSLAETADLLKEGSISLEEASRQLNSYLGKLEFNPTRHSFLEQRLSIIHRLKRKYGGSCAEIAAYQKELSTKLALLENLSEEIESAEQKWRAAAQETEQYARALTAKRKSAAAQLERTLTAVIQKFNMPHAKLAIHVTAQARSSSGEDHVELWLQPNPGEPSLPVKESSSGGELSRLLLAIKTTFAEKNRTPTLIFDEIDANVGGETATIIGDELLTLAKSRQVIAITHFPQVAAKAQHHLRVQKQEREGRTIASIESLTKKEREKELLRMLGGKKINA